MSIELRAQCLAVDERHDIEQEAVRGAGIEERQDVRMLERRGGLDFDHEAVGAEHRGKFRLEELQRDLAIVLEIVAEIDGRHAALAEVALDPISAGEGRVEAVGLLGHG